jgi:hypothetical protein
MDLPPVGCHGYGIPAHTRTGVSLGAAAMNSPPLLVAMATELLSATETFSTNRDTANDGNGLWRWNGKVAIGHDHKRQLLSSVRRFRNYSWHLCYHIRTKAFSIFIM